MPAIWGVDSFSPADTVVNRQSGRPTGRVGEPRGPEEENLYDHVSRRVGREPRFWGRYLGRPLSGSQLTTRERDYLFQRSGGQCRILLVYNGTLRDRVCWVTASGHELCRLNGGHDYGRRAAAEASALASSLGAPPGVRIYADLEGWFVQPEWIVGWWEAMSELPYAVGLYGRAAELLRAYRPGGRRWHPRGTWAANVPAAGEQVHSRRLAADLEQLAAGQGLPPETSCYIWSNQPRSGDIGPHTPPDQIIPSHFAAVGPPGGYTDTVVWQYRMGCFRSDPADENTGLIDMDLALELGYRDMWQGERRRDTRQSPLHRPHRAA